MWWLKQHVKVVCCSLCPVFILFPCQANSPDERNWDVICANIHNFLQQKLSASSSWIWGEIIHNVFVRLLEYIHMYYSRKCSCKNWKIVVSTKRLINVKKKIQLSPAFRFEKTHSKFAIMPRDQRVSLSFFRINHRILTHF